MKVKIEAQFDFGESHKAVVEKWLEKATKSMRLSRYLVDWKVTYDETVKPRNGRWDWVD